MVFGIGLLRRLDLPRYESCVLGREEASGGPGSHTCGGGDCLVTRCMWQQGFAWTDPGFGLSIPCSSTRT